MHWKGFLLIQESTVLHGSSASQRTALRTTQLDITLFHLKSLFIDNGDTCSATVSIYSSLTIVTDLQTNGALNKREAEVERAWGLPSK